MPIEQDPAEKDLPQLFDAAWSYGAMKLKKSYEGAMHATTRNK
jgi:hypothetical protein